VNSGSRRPPRPHAYARGAARAHRRPITDRSVAWRSGIRGETGGQRGTFISRPWVRSISETTSHGWRKLTFAGARLREATPTIPWRMFGRVLADSGTWPAVNAHRPSSSTCPPRYFLELPRCDRPNDGDAAVVRTETFTSESW